MSPETIPASLVMIVAGLLLIKWGVSLRDRATRDATKLAAKSVGEGGGSPQGAASFAHKQETGTSSSSRLGTGL